MHQMDRLLGHDRWMTLHLLDICAQLPAADLDREFDIGHRTLRRTFDHIWFAVDFWAILMDGGGPRGEPGPAPLPEMRARYEAAYDHFERVARRIIAEERLDGTFRDHMGIPQGYGASILAPIMNAHWHRSEILHMLQRLGLPNLPQGGPRAWERATGLVPGTGAR
jgi:uncharacterized damage-inducible protein DinB